METTVEIGKKGEEIAVEYLISKGYKIRERNWSSNHKEIDIIATKDDCLVIIEVKARASSSLAYEGPLDAIDRKKQAFLISAANSYIFRNNISMETRFDIVAVIFKGERHTIEHIEDAFYPLVRKK